VQLRARCLAAGLFIGWIVLCYRGRNVVELLESYGAFSYTPVHQR